MPHDVWFALADLVPSISHCPVGWSIGGKTDESITTNPSTPSRPTWKYRVWESEPRVSVNLHNSLIPEILALKHNCLYRSIFRITKLTEIYGPVFSLRQGSQLFVVIGRYNAAIDIMEKDGASLADRPRSVAGGEIISGNMRISLVGSGDRLRRFRRYGPTQLQYSILSIITYYVGSFMLTFSPR